MKILIDYTKELIPMKIRKKMILIIIIIKKVFMKIIKIY